MNLLRLKGRMADLEAQEFDSQVKDVEREILCAIDDFYEKILNNLDIDYIGPEVTDDEGIAMFNRCIESVGNVGGMSLNEAMGYEYRLPVLDIWDGVIVGIYRSFVMYKYWTTQMGMEAGKPSIIYDFHF